MKSYAILLRGINVGGKNTIPMKELKLLLEKQGFEKVKTLLNSGNAALQSDLTPEKIKAVIEKSIMQGFRVDNAIIRVLVLSHEQLEKVITGKPKGFAEHPEKYHSDVIFLMGITVEEAMKVFSPREGVDTVWQGENVIYSQRLSAELTKSRLGKIIGTKPYKSMTIRTMNTVVKLNKILEEMGKRLRV